MKIYPLVRAEFARITSSRIGIASLIALMTVPVIYGGLYLWGNQDPYSNLDQVPAAIVVSDTGATVDGSTENYGQDAADSLLEDGTFGWHVVSADEAAEGVVDGTYDFAITFPADFSTDISSASGDDPEQAELLLTTNDTNSYLSTTLAKQAAATVRTTIAQNVGRSASATLLGAIGDIRDGLVSASDGATQLSDGAATAATGSASLAEGTAALATGASSLSTGLDTLADKAAALPSSASQLSTGATAVANGLSTASTSVGTLATSTAQAAALAPSVRAQVAQAFTDAGVDPATSGPILARLDQETALTGGINTAVGTQLSPALTALKTGSAQVAAGAATLAASAPALTAGLNQAAAGASTLADGAADAAAGATSLSDGISELSAGSTELSDSLADAVTEVPEQSAAEQTAAADAIADPVDVTQDAITEAGNYGAGLAPFFLSLAAWIGMYALFLLVRPLSRRALTAVRRPFRTAIAGWIPPMLLGVVQMVGLFLVAIFALHLTVANAAGLLGFMIFVSMTFAAIVLALNALFGSVGQFLGLLLMILQLVTAGGTFPWQTLPAPLRALHQALPMSHAVDGMRQLMYGGTTSALLSAIVPLLLWLVGGIAVATLAARRQGATRRLREIRPSAIGG